jgi:hypothetical protein
VALVTERYDTMFQIRFPNSKSLPTGVVRKALNGLLIRLIVDVENSDCPPDFSSSPFPVGHEG